MNKKEASTVLKELLVKCKLDSNSFVLLEPNPRDKLSTGYKIRVKAMLDNDCRRKLRQITKKQDLAVIEEEAQIVIYKPKSNHAGLVIE
jgi:hypothetical protein